MFMKSIGTSAPPKQLGFGIFRPRLIFVHIGKCGGASLRKAIDDSLIIQKRFRTVERVHIRKPKVVKGAKYLIVLRNPIERAISAFNWRFSLVVESGAQKNRFPGEFEILLKYRSINVLAESLYVNGYPNAAAISEFRKIHHLKESISFYLSDLVEEVKESQIFAVLATEFLEKDISESLGVNNPPHLHKHRGTQPTSRLSLSDLGKKNLVMVLADDYLAIQKLLDIKAVSAEKQRVLLSRS